MERWRDVVGVEGYAVSDLGRVWSFRSGRPLTLTVSSKGYVSVTMGGRPRQVHHLVLDAFVGPRPFPRAECRHLDGNPGNNRPSNLAWGTRADNAADKARHRTHNNTRRQTCRRRGHALVPTNLTEHDLAHGRRRCRACHLGFTKMVNARRHGRHYDRDVLADQLYAHFIGEGPDPRGDPALWRLAELDGPAEARVAGGRLRTDTPSAETRVLALVEPGEVFSQSDVRRRATERHVDVTGSAINGCLSRAALAGRMERIGRGRYRAPAAPAPAAEAV